MSNVVNYIQYNRHPKNFHSLDIKAVNQKSHKRKHNKEEERQMFELRFWRHAGEIKRRIRIQSATSSTTSFDRYIQKSPIILAN